MKVFMEFLRLKCVETAGAIKSILRCLLEFLIVMAAMLGVAVFMWIPGYLAIGLLAIVNMPLVVRIIDSVKSDAPPIVFAPMMMGTALLIVGLLGFLAWEALKWLGSNWQQAKRNVREREEEAQISG